MYLVHSADNLAISSGRLNLDKVYSACLERILDGQPLAKIITFYLQYLEQHTPGFRFAVMQAIRDTQTLSLLSAPSLPDIFVRAIHDIKINEHEAACGPAAATQQPYFIDNIAAHPNWRDFSPEMAEIGITSCWSFPLMREQQCVGTLAITGGLKQTPDPHTVSHYQAVAANLSKIFAYCDYQQGKNSANWILRTQVAEKEDENAQWKLAYEKLAEKYRQAEHNVVHRPLPKTFRPMALGLISEIESLLAVVQTTFSFQQVLTEQNKRNVSLKQLSREGLNQYYHSVNRASAEGVSLLVNAQKQIEALNSYVNLLAENPLQSISIPAVLTTVNAAIASAVRHINIITCANLNCTLMMHVPVGSFSQILSELILNVYLHAYPNQNTGKLWVTAQANTDATSDQLQLVIEDEGIPISRTIASHAMREVSTTLMHQHGKQNGLTMCYQQVTAGLGGTMQILPRAGGGNKIIITLPKRTQP